MTEMSAKKPAVAREVMLAVVQDVAGVPPMRLGEPDDAVAACKVFTTADGPVLD